MVIANTHELTQNLRIVYRMFLQLFQIDKLKDRHVGGVQIHAWGLASFIGFLPTQNAQAPAIASLESRELEHWIGSRKIVSPRFGKRQEFFRHFGTKRVEADVFGAGVATAIAKEARHGVRTAFFQTGAKNILSAVHIRFPLRYFRPILD
jgi:hypothetical protein